jgi:hypothetical protein
MKRASLMASNEKKSSSLTGDDADATAGFTRRLLMSAVFDVMEMREHVERVQIQIFTLARANGVPVPETET